MCLKDKLNSKIRVFWEIELYSTTQHSWPISGQIWSSSIFHLNPLVSKMLIPSRKEPPLKLHYQRTMNKCGLQFFIERRNSDYCVHFAPHFQRDHNLTTGTLFIARLFWCLFIVCWHNRSTYKRSVRIRLLFRGFNVNNNSGSLA